MFGYVRTDKGELKVREYELYRGLYCTLCKQLSKRYGVLSRLILSYDMTFLALVRLSEKGISPKFKGGRCPFNPAKRCNYCTNAEDEYAFVCAAAILMFYYKVKDNISDSPFFKRLLFFLLLPFAAIKRKKAKKLFPQLDSLISDCLQKQAETERKNTSSMKPHTTVRMRSEKFFHSVLKKRKRSFTFSDTSLEDGSILWTRSTTLKRTSKTALSMFLSTNIH